MNCSLWFQPRGLTMVSTNFSMKSRLTSVYMSRLWATPSRSMKSIIARFMRALLCPKLSTPAPAKKSMYDLPFSSVCRALDADLNTVGYSRQ